MITNVDISQNIEGGYNITSLESGELHITYLTVAGERPSVVHVGVGETYHSTMGVVYARVLNVGSSEIYCISMSGVYEVTYYKEGRTSVQTEYLRAGDKIPYFTMGYSLIDVTASHPWSANEPRPLLGASNNFTEAEQPKNLLISSLMYRKVRNVEIRDTVLRIKDTSIDIKYYEDPPQEQTVVITNTPRSPRYSPGLRGLLNTMERDRGSHNRTAPTRNSTWDEVYLS